MSKAKAKKNEPRTPRRWPRWLMQIGAGVAVSTFLVGGVVAVGNLTRNSLGPQDRYLLSFSEIECPVPPGMEKSVFLSEVQYSRPFPDQINILDPALPDQLREAFSNHRHVVEVGKITIMPAKKVKVELSFR